MTSTTRPCPFLLPLLLALAPAACETAPESLGSDAPPLPSGTRTHLVALPELAPTTFEVTDDASIWIGAARVELETYDPEESVPGWLGVVDADGELRWSQTLSQGEFARDIAATSAGVGVLILSAEPRVEFRAADGSILWSAPAEGFAHLAAIGPDLLLAGDSSPQDGTPRHALVRRISSAGEMLWETQLDPIGPGDRVVGGLGVNAQGVVWVGGAIRDDLVARWWAARIDEGGDVLGETVSEIESAPEQGYALTVDGDAVVLASSPVPTDVHQLDGNGDLQWSLDDPGAIAGGTVVATPGGIASLLTLRDQPEATACATPWSPCPDGLLIRHFTDGAELSWSARQEDCAGGVESKVHEGDLLVLSACIETGTGATSLDLSGYTL